MHLQNEQILRGQGNGRGRGIDRHGTPELFQLHQTLCNTSEVRKELSGVRATRIPILCGRQMHQMCYCSGRNHATTEIKRYGRIKEHLSYGGRATLRRCPFFMPSITVFSQIPLQARKNKQANTGLRPSFHCVCLPERRGPQGNTS